MADGIGTTPNLTSSMPVASPPGKAPAKYSTLVIDAPTSEKPKKRVPPKATFPAGMSSTTVLPSEYGVVNYPRTPQDFDEWFSTQDACFDYLEQLFCLLIELPLLAELRNKTARNRGAFYFGSTVRLKPQPKAAISNTTIARMNRPLSVHRRVKSFPRLIDKHHGDDE